ncbi:MAG: response regulator [Leptospirales bacterium]|nr:response regulator [Leptospirales bacterium]
MEILIIDPDRSVREYYKRMLESEFRQVQVHFAATGAEALGFVAAQSCDICLSETRLPDLDIFDLLIHFHQRRIPVIVVTSEDSERLAVECMRAGAADFVSRGHIKLGHLPLAIARAVLEYERAEKARAAGATVELPAEYDRINQRLKSYIQVERAELRRRVESADADPAFIDGERYWITYLYLQLFYPESIRSTLDERRLLALQERILSRLCDIPGTHEGKLWTRKEDGAFFAFPGDTYLGALLAAVEMRATVNILNMTVDNLTESVQINIGLAAGQTVYRENKSQIYSEALNLSAHMAINNPERSVLMMTADIYEKIGPRARKYFFAAGQFEGREVYRYERTA